MLTGQKCAPFSQKHNFGQFSVSMCSTFNNMFHFSWQILQFCPWFCGSVETTESYTCVCLCSRWTRGLWALLRVLVCKHPVWQLAHKKIKGCKHSCGLAPDPQHKIYGTQANYRKTQWHNAIQLSHFHRWHHAPVGSRLAHWVHSVPSCSLGQTGNGRTTVGMTRIS